MDLRPTSSAVEPARYWLQLPDGTYPIREIRGTEQLSKPFRFEIELRLEKGQDSLTAAELSRCDALIGLHRGQALQRVLRGVATEIRVGASLEGTPDVHLVVEPHLALLRHRTDSRVFRDKTVPEIVDEVLEPFEWIVEWRLQGEYAVRPYTVQYQENDLDFIHRLLEDEGIFYFIPDWTDYDESEDKRPVVVCCDHAAAYQPIAGESLLAFIAGHGLDTDVERISAIGPRQALTVSKVSLRDFNADKPGLDMDVAAAGPTPGGVEFYDYPGKYPVPPEGERKAALMSEAFARAADWVEARSDCARLRPGGRFALASAPSGVADGGYAARSLTHRWNREDDVFDLVLTCLAETRTYRPPRVTPTPQLGNTLTGFVTGPEGGDIHCDSMGRVKVRFPWDRLQPMDDTVSDWIPVLQDNTGSSSAIPRVGWEVLVGFLEGDPDRPVVLGRTYNGEDPFPEPLPAGKTRTALKSLNSPGRDGHNLVRIDDIAGSELMTLHAELDQDVNVANDKREQVLNTEANWIGGNEVIQVGANNETIVGKSAELTVQGDQTTTIGASQSTQVTDDTSDDVSGNRFTSIGGIHYRRIGDYDTVQTGVLVELVGGLCLETSIKPNRTSSSKLQTLTVGGALVELTCKEKTETAQTKRLETIGGLVSTDAAVNFAVRADGARTTTVGGVLDITGDSQVVLEGATTVHVTSAASSVYQGGSLTCKVGGSSVAFAGGNITVKSAGKIVLDGGGAASLLADAGLLNS